MAGMQQGIGGGGPAKMVGFSYGFCGQLRGLMLALRL